MGHCDRQRNGNNHHNRLYLYQCLQILSGHNGVIPSIAFSPQGNTLVSASHDETIKLWNVNTGECLKTLRSPKLYENTNFEAVSGITEAQIMTLKALGGIVNNRKMFSPFPTKNYEPNRPNAES